MGFSRTMKTSTAKSYLWTGLHWWLFYIFVLNILLCSPGNWEPSLEEHLKTASYPRVSSSFCTFSVGSQTKQWIAMRSQVPWRIGSWLQRSWRRRCLSCWTCSTTRWTGRKRSLTSKRFSSGFIPSYFFSFCQARVAGTGKALMDRNMPPVAGQLNFSQEMRLTYQMLVLSFTLL